MRPPSLVTAMPLIALVVASLHGTDAAAGIIGINSATSSATITFDDTNSVGPPNGIINGGPTVTSWNGSTHTLGLTTDGNTSDFAAGSVSATFTPSSNVYAINFSGVTLSQPLATTTGFATLDFTFSVEYQLDAAGLPLQPTLAPIFVVTGTVQNILGSHADVNGSINYSGVVTSGAITPLATVTYAQTWTTPGPFTATVFGTPLSSTTAALMPNTSLYVNGNIQFRVDPSSIQAYSIQSVPEPSSLALLALGLTTLAACARRRRAGNGSAVLHSGLESE